MNKLFVFENLGHEMAASGIPPEPEKMVWSCRNTMACHGFPVHHGS